jgi:pimeloyl-ACP methyl ester carboxylesterase
MRRSLAGRIPARRPSDRSLDAIVNQMTPPLLATHEWSATDADPSPRVAVLVHGLMGWHRTWWRVGPALAEQGWRVIAPDQLGHGHSPRIDGAATIDDFADALEATIRDRLPGAVDLLIGHSLGAVVSMRLAERSPGLVRRLVLEDPPSLDRTGDEAFLASVVEGVRLAREQPEVEVRRELAENPAWLAEDARQDVEGRALTDAAGIVASLRHPRGFDVADLGPRLPMPVLWILGDERRSVLLGEARDRLRGTLPARARLVETGAGHTVHRDRFDEYIAAVLEWIQPSR